MIISRDDALDLIEVGNTFGREDTRFVMVADERVGHARWVSEWILTFRTADGKFFSFIHYTPLTEMQECDPLSYDGDQPTVVYTWEVEPYMKTVVKYRPKPK